MTKERRTEGMNLSFDGMIWAQELMDAATSERDRRIARAMYESFWCLWTVLTDKGAGERCSPLQDKEDKHGN